MPNRPLGRFKPHFQGGGKSNAPSRLSGGTISQNTVKTYGDEAGHGAPADAQLRWARLGRRPGAKSPCPFATPTCKICVPICNYSLDVGPTPAPDRVEFLVSPPPRIAPTFKRALMRRFSMLAFITRRKYWDFLPDEGGCIKIRER
jgi:hypothetical protein